MTFILQKFDEHFRNFNWEKNLSVLKFHQKTECKHIIIGHDHVFRENKSGNFRTAPKLSTELDLPEQLQAIKNEDDFNISSTKIRNCLGNGKHRGRQ